MSWLRWSMKKRVASTPMSSISSSRVTKSPLRLDIRLRSPPSTMRDHLHDRRLEAVRVDAERRERRPHPRHVAVVVGAEDVDQPLDAALELVEVVGDVGGEVGRLAVGADQDPVLVVAEVGRPQPDRALALVDVAGVAQLARARARPPPTRAGARSEDQVSKLDAEALQRRLDPRPHRLGRRRPRARRGRPGRRLPRPARRRARRRTRRRSRPRAARRRCIRAAIDSANSRIWLPASLT